MTTTPNLLWCGGCVVPVIEYDMDTLRLILPRPRDLAFEALAEVTASDPEVARGALNAALRDIKKQEPEILDSFLLSAEIHDRAAMYRVVFEGAALTPNALAKHWKRVKAEVKTSRTDLAPPPSLPPSRREQNLEEARKILAMFEK